jgi:hypothetical protein
VGSGQRLTFAADEAKLSAWMADNAFVTWVETDRPWLAEQQLIASVNLPLNLDQNRHHAFSSAADQGQGRCPHGGAHAADRVDLNRPLPSKHPRRCEWKQALVIPLVIPPGATPHNSPALAGQLTRPDLHGRHSTTRRGRRRSTSDRKMTT